jgi:hypothetical protein
MARKRLQLWKLLLVTLGLGSLALVGCISWVLYKAQHPKELNFAQVQQSLVGNTPAILHQVVGWGSKRYGFDDGSHWIEFKTDATGLKALLDSRPFVQIPADREVSVGDFIANPERWRGLHTTYEDSSQFDRHGTTYYVMAQDHEDGVMALVSRSQQ